MSYLENYYRLNWKILNEIGVSRPDNKSLVFDPDGCSNFKLISCPFSLSILVHMALHVHTYIFKGKELFEYFLSVTRGNLFIFEHIFEKLLSAKYVMEVE